MQARGTLMKWRIFLMAGRVNKNAVKDIKFETMMIVPSVLLQKPPKSSEAKYHLKEHCGSEET